MSACLCSAVETPVEGVAMSTNLDEGPLNAALASPPLDPGAGPTAVEPMALKHRASDRESPESSGARQPCTAMTKRGVACGRPVGTRDFGEGPRCPAHRPKIVTAVTISQEVRSPVRSLKTP